MVLTHSFTPSPWRELFIAWMFRLGFALTIAITIYVTVFAA